MTGQCNHKNRTGGRCGRWTTVRDSHGNFVCHNHNESEARD